MHGKRGSYIVGVMIESLSSGRLVYKQEKKMIRNSKIMGERNGDVFAWRYQINPGHL